MSRHISKRIADIFVNNEVITAEDRDIYTYGIKQGFLIILNIATTIFIGIIFRMVWQSVIFLLAYIPLRSYAGGYHAKSQTSCYLLSIVIISAVLLGIKIIPWTEVTCLTLVVGAVAIIIFFAPVEDDNKPLDRIEKNVYKKRTLVVLSLLLLIAIMFYKIGQSSISICIIMALVVLSIMLVLGKIKIS